MFRYDSKLSRNCFSFPGCRNLADMDEKKKLMEKEVDVGEPSDPKNCRTLAFNLMIFLSFCALFILPLIVITAVTIISAFRMVLSIFHCILACCGVC